MKLSDFNMVTGCGDSDRVIMRYKDICRIGCFSGTREEAIKAIEIKYKGLAKDTYIAKINELFTTDISSYKERGIDITANNNYAIQLASENGHLEVVKYLGKHGADVTASDNRAVQWASRSGYLEVIKYLVSQGADVATNNIRAIQLASGNGHLEVVKYLVKHGADITAGDNYAINTAFNNGHSEVAKYLASQGAILDQ